MARPKNKQDLFEQATDNYEKMWEIINSMPKDKRHESFELDGKEVHWKRDKNVRDVIVHLYEWHQLLLNWIKANKAGATKPFLPEPYNWKTYGDMNVEFWKKHQKTKDEDAVKMLKQSHEDVMKLVGKFSDKELFEKAHFPWTGTTNLGSYAISATSSHYDWAIKKLKKV